MSSKKAVISVLKKANDLLKETKVLSRTLSQAGYGKKSKKGGKRHKGKGGFVLPSVSLGGISW